MRAAKKRYPKGGHTTDIIFLTLITQAPESVSGDGNNQAVINLNDTGSASNMLELDSSLHLPLATVGLRQPVLPASTGDGHEDHQTH